MANLKYTIAYMNDLASKKGGKCLSEKYLGYSEKLLWECAKGHQWWTAPQLIIKKSWCPECFYDLIRNSIEIARKLAKKHGGKLVSQEYKNSYSLLKWECAAGHKFKKTLASVQQGVWCPKCSIYNKELNLKILQEIVKKRGGKILSKEYVSCHSEIQLETADHIRWWATPTSIKGGHWYDARVHESTRKNSRSRKRTKAKM